MPEHDVSRLNKAQSIFFIGLATYSQTGGLQNFNRRLIRNLAFLTQTGKVSCSLVHLMDDVPADIPAPLSSYVRGFGRKRVRFLLSNVLRAKDFDQILLGHINLLPVAWLIRCLNPNIVIKLFVHGDEVWNDELRPRRIFDRRMLKVVDRIASVSMHTAHVMSKEYSVKLERFTLFPNAIDDFAVPERRVLGSTRILCVTRLGVGDRRKNVDQLVRAVALLRERMPQIHLSIVGDGVLKTELEDLAKSLDLDRHIQFLGRVSDEMLSKIYGEADLFVLPSSKEGFGIVYLEAWSRGLPVVCGSRGAPHEIIEDGVDGRHVDEDSITNIADTIEAILGDPDNACEMGRKGLMKVRSHYLNGNALTNLSHFVELRL